MTQASTAARPRWTRAHLWVALAMLALVALPVLPWLWSNRAANGEGPLRIALTTLAMASGPLAGAAARPGHDSCLRFSLELLPWFAGTLALAVACQWLPWPDRSWARATRLFVWALGWAAWFGGALVSFGHALE